MDVTNTTGQRASVNHVHHYRGCLMRHTLKRQLRRLAAGVAAVVVASGTIVSTTVPARADSFLGPWAVENWTTGACLVTDHSSRVYTYWDCYAQVKWTFQLLDAYPGTFVMRNQLTGRCLMQFDYTRVISSPACDGSQAGFRWTSTGDVYRSANTGGYLTNVVGTDIVQLTSQRQQWVVHG
jgi:hypothetical protein